MEVHHVCACSLCRHTCSAVVAGTSAPDSRCSLQELTVSWVGVVCCFVVWFVLSGEAHGLLPNNNTMERVEIVCKIMCGAHTCAPPRFQADIAFDGEELARRALDRCGRVRLFKVSPPCCDTPSNLLTAPACLHMPPTLCFRLKQLLDRCVSKGS